MKYEKMTGLSTDLLGTTKMETEVIQSEIVEFRDEHGQ
jgi:hypothetical protein